jgi:hypothetical protein
MSLSLLPLFREFSCLRNDTLHLSSPAILRTMAPHIVLLSANSLIAVSRKSLTLLVSLTLCPVIAIHTSKYNCATVFALAPFIVSTGFRAFGECASCPAHLLDNIDFQLIDGSCLSGSSPQLQNLDSGLYLVCMLRCLYIALSISCPLCLCAACEVNDERIVYIIRSGSPGGALAMYSFMVE